MGPATEPEYTDARLNMIEILLSLPAKLQMTQSIALWKDLLLKLPKTVTMMLTLIGNSRRYSKGKNCAFSITKKWRPKATAIVHYKTYKVKLMSIK